MSKSTHTRKSSRLLVLIAALAIIALLAAAGGLALFTSSGTRTTTITTGTVTISLSDPGTAVLEDPITNFLAGDYRDRAITVNNDSSNPANNGNLTLDWSGTGANALTTDAVNGLTVQIWECDEEYAETGTGPYSYTCGGTETAVQASTPFATTATVDLATPFTADAGYYRIRVGIPSAADNATSGLSTDVTWTFTMSQRAGQQV